MPYNLVYTYMIKSYLHFLIHNLLQIALHLQYYLEHVLQTHYLYQKENSMRLYQKCKHRQTKHCLNL